MDEHLKKTYGYNSFRSHQKDIIQDIVRGSNVFAVLPTGGGKSLLYQFPATYLNKITLVISPLLSLMNDQCLSLEAHGITSITLNSLSKQCNLTSDCECNICSIKKKLVKPSIIYTTPEWLKCKSGLLYKIKDMFGLIAIDEAHCVSQWSHDFRPAYREIIRHIKDFKNIPILAVTATATPHVLEDIYDILNIEEICEYLLGTRRTNIAISVLSKNKWDIKKAIKPNESTIVYTQTRKETERLADEISSHGISCMPYHAGLSKQDRMNAHEKFLSNEIKVVVATISFGMGIDKSGIRHVINYGVPNDIESYYQEIGRAGRDGLPSRATIYYNGGDFCTASFLIDKTNDERQKKLGKEKLDLLERYLSNKNVCRQAMIDTYFKTGNIFDEEENINCGICDNCCNDHKSAIIDISEIAQKIYTRIKHQKFPVGLKKTSDLCKDYGSPKYLKWLIPILSDKGVLKKTSTKWGPVYDVSQELSMPVLVEEPPDDIINTVTIDTVHGEYCEYRNILASKAGVAPSVLINDRLLMNLEAKRAKTLADLWNIDGISDDFLMTYGAEWLDLTNSKSKKKKDKAKKGDKSGGNKKNTLDITYDLYKQGMSIRKIADTRSMSIITIEEHILTIFEKYEEAEINPDIFGLTEEIESEIRKIINIIGDDKLKPIKNRLRKDITYGQIKLTLLLRRLEEAGSIEYQ